MKLSPSAKRNILRLIGLFSVVRGYNILLVCIAQYLAAMFVFAKNESLTEVLLDDELFMLVLAGAFAIAGGYIINSFYDFEKDIINKPFKSMIDRLVSQNTKLTVYFLFNFFSIFVAGYVSFRAILFFSGYIFGMWLYSHRLKKIPFVGNITSAFLSITPFFAVFIYYKNFDTIIFVHATLLFLLILIKEFIKDLENLPGDLTHNYRTVPVRYGERISKIGITVMAVLCFVPIYVLIFYFRIGFMAYYVLFVAVFLVFFVMMLWINKNLKTYLLLHNLLKILLVMGVFSVLLLDVHAIINKLW
ncbi:MAG: geranylgeranylglycerol-phosphate geranylgeranyltransferase [Capnocytophaga sp.]|nr:geranylgeranylglycerol-phosphate geranylgeranyltransferase [Capnocytophaga sp.]